MKNFQFLRQITFARGHHH